MTDDASIAAAVEQVEAESGGLDVLINNAGIAGSHSPVPETIAEDVAHVFDTSVFGIVRVTRAFLPLLERSANPVIVNVSSGLGSLTVTGDPTRIEFTINSLAYPASKTAVNMVTSQYAKGLPQIRINAVDPGYTGTDLNAHRGIQTVTQGTDAIVRMACLDTSGPTGRFVDANGVVPW